MREVRIGGKAVGEGRPCFIVAEAGSNHNGSLAQAKKMIDAAAKAGADAVKFQVFTAEGLYSKYTPPFKYLKGKKTFDLIKGIETPRKWVKDLAAHCRKKKVFFLASPFDSEAVDLLCDFVPAFKIASFEIVDLELLRFAASKGLPMVLSTGMSDLGEIEDAVKAVRSTGNGEIILLHCNSLYPTPPGVVNLKAMETMREAFKLPVGFSDHTEGIHVPIAAAALGACMVEKHFTLDRSLPGPDHSFALEPDELSEMVRGIREVETALGSGVKEKSDLEGGEMFVKARRSIHARVDIEKGSVIEKKMLAVKRPGYGIKPKFLDLVVGRKARRDILEDEWITWDSI